MSYLRTNYRVTGGYPSGRVLAGSYHMVGQHTISFATGNYYTDIAALIGFTGSVLFFNAYPQYQSYPAASFAVDIRGEPSVGAGAATVIAVFNARYPIFACCASGAGEGGLSFLGSFTTSIGSAAAQTLVCGWECLVYSHYGNIS